MEYDYLWIVRYALPGMNIERKTKQNINDYPVSSVYCDGITEKNIFIDIVVYLTIFIILSIIGTNYFTN